MDEPTTGTDAQTRRMLWTVIAEATRGRCVLLTTHRMDEADVLCSRIAILASGRLRCIGPQQVHAGTLVLLCMCLLTQALCVCVSFVCVCIGAEDALWRGICAACQLPANNATVGA